MIITRESVNNFNLSLFQEFTHNGLLLRKKVTLLSILTPSPTLQPRAALWIAITGRNDVARINNDIYIETFSAIGKQLEI